MAEYLPRSAAYDIGTLADWYITSVMADDPPIWTDEHLEELLKDFYLIPKDTPAANVRPVVRGRWEGAEYDGYADGRPVYDTWRCTACGEEIDSDDEPCFAFCPNCGADMRPEARA